MANSRHARMPNSDDNVLVRRTGPSSHTHIDTFTPTHSWLILGTHAHQIQMTMLWSDARGLQVPDPSAPIDHNDVAGVSLYTYMYVTFIYVYIHIYMRAYIHARIPIDYNYVAGVSLHHVYMHICVHIYACTYMRTYIHACMYARI